MSDTKYLIGTGTRTVILAFALFNQIMTALGKPIINISNEDISLLVSTGITVISAVAAWWKNNSFTKAARAGDKTMRRLKEGNNEQSDYGG